MDENKKIMFLIGGVFLVAMGFQIFSTYIPSLMATTQTEEASEETLKVQERIKNDLQKALDKYIEVVNKVETEESEDGENSQAVKVRQVPKSFDEFVIYQDNMPEKAEFKLDKYAKNFIEEDPVKGLDTKTLVIKINQEDSKEPITAVFLLNQTLISLTEM